MEQIRLLRSKGKLGRLVSCKDYDGISHFVLEAVQTRGAMSLSELIDLAYKLHNKEKSRLCLRLLLDVKQDLEAREIIKIEWLPNRVQLIRLNRRGNREQINVVIHRLLSTGK